MARGMVQVQQKIKSSSTGLLLFTLRLFTGFMLGLTFALIGQEIFEYMTLAFSLVIIVTTLAFLKISKGWKILGVMIFNLICVLVGMLLRMYVIVAPGS